MSSSAIRIDEAAFLAAVSEALGRPVSDLRLEATLVDDLELGPAGVLGLVASLRALNPDLDVPRQASLADLSLADLHHHTNHMTRAHREIT